MEIILIEDVKDLGLAGELQEVADGYARNYLFPQQKAVRATDTNRERFAEEQEKLREERQRREDAARERAEDLAAVELTIAKNAAEEGSLYGSVSQTDIAEALHEEGFDEITSRQVILDEVIDEIGEHQIRVSLAGSVDVEVSIEVVPA